MVQKDDTLAEFVEVSGTKTNSFQHKGKTIVVEYVKPTVSTINEARDQAMVIQQKGRSVNYKLKVFDFEVKLLKSCLKGSNIPGIPERGEVFLRNINDAELWNKLLISCEIKDEETPQTDDIVTAAEEVVQQLGTDNPAVANLAQILNKDREEDDLKKS